MAKHEGPITTDVIEKAARKMLSKLGVSDSRIVPYITHDSDGDLSVVFIGQRLNDQGVLAQPGDEEKPVRTVRVSGTVEVEWSVEVEEDPENPIEDVDGFADAVAEAVRFSTDLPGTVSEDGYTMFPGFDGADVRDVDYDIEDE